MMRGHSRIMSLELPVPSGFTGNKINFTDTQTSLMRSDGDKDVAIYSITSYTSLSLPLSVGGNTVATEVQVANAFLSLYILGNVQVMQISMRRFLNQQNAAAGDFNAREYFNTAPLRVDWTNSFVEFAAPGTVDTPAYSFIFEFEYEWFPVGSIQAYINLKRTAWAQGKLE